MQINNRVLGGCQDDSTETGIGCFAHSPVTAPSLQTEVGVANARSDRHLTVGVRVAGDLKSEGG